jgi:hypothetical protein
MTDGEMDAPKGGAPAPQTIPDLLRFLPVLALLLALAFLAVRVNKGIYLGDEGVACMAAWRIADGQAPVADFFQIETPLSFWMLSGFVRALGPTVLASRAAGLFYGLALIGLVAWLSRLLLNHPVPRAAVLALLIPFGVGAWPFASHHWAVDLFLLGALGALAKGIEATSLGWPLAGGAMAAAGALCLQDQGGYAIVLVSLAVVPALPAVKRWRFAAAWGGGLALVGAGALLVLIARGASLHQMIADWILFPTRQYGGLQGSMWEAAGGWGEVFSGLSLARLSAAPIYLPLMLLAYGVLFLLPAVALLAAVPCVWRRWFGLPKSLLLVAVSLAFLGAAAHRWAIMNLVWAAAVPALLAAAWADRHWDDEARGPRLLARWATGACLAVLLAFGAAGALRQSLTSPRGIDALAGTLHTFDPAQAAALQPFLDAIEARVPAGAPAFSWGYIPMVNFLTGHPNPTRYNIFITSPPYNSPEQVRDWIDTLERARVDWGFSHAFPRDPTDPAAPYVRDHYETAWSNGAYTLWHRRGAARLPR